MNYRESDLYSRSSSPTPWQPPRSPRVRLLRLFQYVIVALIVHFIWARFSLSAFSNSPSSNPILYTSPDLPTSSHHIDYAWGSILHRFQNHPLKTRARPALPPEPKTKKDSLRLLIVTSELEGLHKNGGIGTAFYELATTLAKHDDHLFEVSILITNTASSFSTHQVTTVISTLKELNVALYFVQNEMRPFYPQGWTAIGSKRVYDFLRARDGEFDVIHFPDNTGIGYFSVLGRVEGLALRKSKILIGMHGAEVEWSAMLNKRYPKDQMVAKQAVFEQRSAELADAIVSPSDYMLDYLHKRGWTLPNQTFVVPNIVPVGPVVSLPENPTPITELVFFGRIEERKGIRLFIEALEILFGPDSTSPLRRSIKTITFLGRDTTDRITHSDVSSLVSRALLVLQTAGQVPFTFSFIKDLNRDDALDYLQSPHRLAILPSLADNSPSTVLECISHSIRFLASSVGGIPELVHHDDHEVVLFHPLPKDLVERITSTVQQSSGMPPRIIRRAPETLSAIGDWVRILKAVAALPDPQPLLSSNIRPLVSVCITHFERPNFLSQLLDSLLLQTYTNLEVVLIDDGSAKPATLSTLAAINAKYFARRKKWRLVESRHLYLGELRNTAANMTTGDYLLFLDDDDVLKPDALQTLVHVASRTNASALSSWLDEFSTEANPLDLVAKGQSVPHRRTYWFTGQSLAVGVLENCFGSGNIFVERGAFNELGGFSTYRDVGGEDWEFYMRLTLGGYSQWVVPQEIIFVRSDPTRDSMKFAMDPWDASYRALVPLLNDRRVQDLKLAHVLMGAKGSHSFTAPPPAFADSRNSFELVQGWNGWTYSFEPTGDQPTLEEDFLGMVVGEQWSTDSLASHPYIGQTVQYPLITPKGSKISAVRTFRSPRAVKVAVRLTYKAKHSCGDGTLLRLLFVPNENSPPQILFARETLQIGSDEFRVTLSLEKDSLLHVISDPLETDECDAVDVRLILSAAELDSDSWSSLARKASLASRAAETAEEDEREANIPARSDHTLPIGLTSSLPEKVFNIALIFDDHRFPHALQVMRSALHFITARSVQFHLVAPANLHAHIRESFDLEFVGVKKNYPRLYDHQLCHSYAAPILAFSNPDIHISAQCKMFLSEILDMTDRVLYLDTDTTIVNDISACYGDPERSKTLISMAVDMGDVCQTQPDHCWPIGLHWRIPEGLECGNIPSRADARAPPSCAQYGELETIQVNGGVAMMELVRMKETNFVERYIQTIVNHYRLVGTPSVWGEQDFINSYFRFFPNELEILPCGCNYQWFGSRREVKCGEQDVYIAHSWAHGIAARTQNPYNKLFYHFLDDNGHDPVPPVPALSDTGEGSPNAPLEIFSNINCPRQSYDCSVPYHRTEYGQHVAVISRIVSAIFVDDLVESVAKQSYKQLTHYVTASTDVAVHQSTVELVKLPMDPDIDGDYTELCEQCGQMAASTSFCDAEPSDPILRNEYWSCACETFDTTTSSLYELEAMASAKSGWILYLTDQQTFVSTDSLSRLMAHASDPSELIVFSSNTTGEGNSRIEYLQKILPRSELGGIGFLFHSSHLDLTEWDGRRCGAWRTFNALSQNLKLKWVKEVPTMNHPLQHQIRRTDTDSPSRFKITIVILSTFGQNTWIPAFLDVLDLPTFRSLVKEIVVFSRDEEDLMHEDTAKIVNATPGFGLRQLASVVDTEGVLIISDSILLDKAAITSLINFWLEDPLRIVGPLTESYPQEFSFPKPTDDKDFDPNFDPDPIIGLSSYSTIQTRALLTSKSHLTTLTNLLEKSKTKLDPICHGILLNGIAMKTTKKPNLRILLPKKSLIDRIWDCRIRRWGNIGWGLQPGDIDHENDDQVPTYEDCVKSVTKILGGKEKEWNLVGTEVGIAGERGSLIGVGVAEGIGEKRWRESRKIDVCLKTFVMGDQPTEAVGLGVEEEEEVEAEIEEEEEEEDSTDDFA